MMNSIRRIAIGGMLSVMLAGLPACVSHRLYNESPEQYLQSLPAEDDQAVPAHLAVIEFDDHGVFWKRSQLEDTVALIREVTREPDESGDGTLVIVYIHGWKNDADPDDPDGALADFRATVRANAARNTGDRPFAADRVVGVFLGWRGDTSDVPGHEELTFWDRRQV
ncbi:MAG: hypothetical protein ACYTEV_10055, partial [Planctomycetota bacterium]